VWVVDAQYQAPSLTSLNEEAATLNGDKLSVLANEGNYTLTVGSRNISLAFNATDAAIANALNGATTNGTYEVELISKDDEPTVYRITFIGNFVPDSYEIRFAAAPALTIENPAVARRINYTGFDTLRIDISATADLDLSVEASGTIETADAFLNFNGTFGVNIDSYDVFDRSAPLLFDISFSGSLKIDNYFLISGDLTFSRQQGALTFSDGRIVDDAIYSLISGNNIDIFAGYLDPGAGGDGDDSQGISIEDVAFSLLTYDDAVGVDASNGIFRALKTTGGSAELVGFEGVEVALRDFSLEVNTSTADDPSLVLDFSTEGSQNGETLSVVLGDEPQAETIDLDFEGDQGQLFGASGYITLQILGYLMAEATFNMKRRSVKLTEGSAPGDDFDLVTFELEDVFAYAGSGNIDVVGVSVTDRTPDGNFTQADLDAIEADPSLYQGTGFAVAHGQIGLALLQSADASAGPRDTRSYMAITSDLGSAQLLGLPSEFKVQATNIAVELNRASGTAADGTTPATALDWASALGADNPTFFAQSGRSQGTDLHG